METLKKLTQIYGVSGCEDRIRDVIKSEIGSYCDEIDIDALGNLIAHKKGNGKKIMLAAHIDEIGVIATFIDDNGFIRFSAVGGLMINELIRERVVFKNGTVGVIGADDEEAFKKDAKIDKLYIDIGAKDKKDAQSKVSIGDSAAFMGEFIETEERVISKALDNRAGCYILTEAIKNIKDNENDLYFVFTTQEEVGLRGAKVSAYSIDPEIAIAIDVTDTFDTPGDKKQPVSLGKGAAIKVMDRSVLCNAQVRCTLIDTAKKNNIPYQLEIMADGGTDAGAIHLSRSGVKTGGISLPVRYIHSPSEMADKNDIKACIELTEKIVNEL